MLRGLLRARDTDLMVAGLRAFGAVIEPWPPKVEQSVKIIPIPRIWQRSARDAASGPGIDQPIQIECGLAGTVMRFLPALAVALGVPARFTADAAANARPLIPLLHALEALGASWIPQAPEALFPFEIHPTRAPFPAEVTIDASASSQFVSALLLAAPLLGQTFTIRSKTAAVPSLPHLKMTLEALQAHGIDARAVAENPPQWRVEPAVVRARNCSIEADLSNAGPFLAAAGITGGQISVSSWPAHTTQAGDAFREILPQFGMKLVLEHDVLTAQGPAVLHSVDVDCQEFGELVPTLAALAAYAEGTSHLRGLHHLRGHETDRLAALHSELSTLGIFCRVTEDDSLVIQGIPKEKLGAFPREDGEKECLLRAYGDHRMATFAALMGLYHPVQIDDISATSKTLPEFPSLWKQMLSTVEAAPPKGHHEQA